MCLFMWKSENENNNLHKFKIIFKGLYLMVFHSFFHMLILFQIGTQPILCMGTPVGSALLLFGKRKQLFMFIEKSSEFDKS